jgi:hypothetical protein
VSYINVWQTTPTETSSNEWGTLDEVKIPETLLKHYRSDDKFKSFDYDEWLAAATLVIKLMDGLDNGQAIVITKDVE